MELLFEGTGGGGGVPQDACAVALDAALEHALKCYSTDIMWQPVTSISTLNSSSIATSDNKLYCQSRHPPTTQRIDAQHATKTR